MLIENLNYHTQGAIQRNWDLKGSKTDREQNISVCIFDHSTYIIMTWKRNTFNGKTLKKISNCGWGLKNAQSNQLSSSFLFEICVI